MVQLQLNQGPQDALLYDNTRSYFTNVGYVRTSNFQIEYRDVDAQNQAQLGTTVQYVIPKAADLLGPVDLVCELDAQLTKTDYAATTTLGKQAWAAWVDEVGYAMIEKITFSVGSNDIETLTGEQLQIINELMKSDEQRLGSNHILKTGLPPGVTASTNVKHTVGDDTTKFIIGHPFPATAAGKTAVDLLNATSQTTPANLDLSNEYSEYSRLIRFQASTVNATNSSTSVAGKAIFCGKKRLIVPLGLFFTKHPSQYFPLAAVAGCNDVRISIKFRAKESLIQLYEDSGLVSGRAYPDFANGGFVSASAKLRCHYVHVTGPEATILMNKEHVRLLKLWHTPNTMLFAPSSTDTAKSMELSFLHPITTLIVTFRCNEELDQTATTGSKGSNKGYFNYHGDGRPTMLGIQDSDLSLDIENISLTINGQERHPSLNNGVDTYYLKNRLMPMLHSNTSDVEKQIAYSYGSSTGAGKAMTGVDSGERLSNLLHEKLNGAKNIFVFPFSLAPEGTNPSGAVNFSKVSHAKLNFKIKSATGWSTSSANCRVDVHAIYYNWLQIKDGRALLSFA